MIQFLLIAISLLMFHSSTKAHDFSSEVLKLSDQFEAILHGNPDNQEESDWDDILLKGLIPLRSLKPSGERSPRRQRGVAYISPVGRSWADADSLCRGRGGQLLSLKTTVKRLVFESYLTFHGVNVRNYWLSLRCVDGEEAGNWVWPDGTIFSASTENFGNMVTHTVCENSLTKNQLHVYRNSSGTWQIQSNGTPITLHFLCERIN